jgi:hypothetical protein
MIVPLGPLQDRRVNAAPPAFKDEPWCIVRTGARCEKIVASRLRASGITCYLPLLRFEREYCGRMCSIELPMFAGHLFARGRVNQIIAAVGAREIRQVTLVADQDSLCWQLRSLESALGSGAPLESCSRPPIQRRAEVRDGPLRGLQGAVEQIDAPPKLIFGIDGILEAYSTGILGSLVVPLDV